MRRLIPFNVGIILMLSAGCYRTYTGFYYLPAWTVERSSERRTLRETVETAIQPFGFAEVQVDLGPDTLLYVNRSEDPEGLHRPGRVRVVIDSSRPFVLVGDLDHDYETAFVRALKEKLENELKVKYGLTELKFVRHIDLFE